MENSFHFFENRECQYFPCHKDLEHINCLFCFCPLYYREDCPGRPEYKEKNGKKIKICTNCTFPHDSEHYDIIMELLKK